jgi:hypothetical protein
MGLVKLEARQLLRSVLGIYHDFEELLILLDEREHKDHTPLKGYLE